MAYKMIVLDLDGTLMSGTNEILPETKAALIKAQEQGLKVVLASGRPNFGMAKAAEELRLGEFGSYKLSYNGSRIHCLKSGDTLYEQTLTPEVAHEIFDLAKEHQLNIMAYEQDGIVTMDDDAYIREEEQINGVKIKRVEDFKAAVDFNTTKVMCTGHPEVLKEAIGKFKERIGDRFSVTRSLPFFLEIMPQNINKAYSLDKLCRHLGIDPAEVIACGDGYNDLEMIEFAGLGVAMGNAVQELKARADYITASNDENGIVQVLEKFIS